jgi:hypothetical protein
MLQNPNNNGDCNFISIITTIIKPIKKSRQEEEEKCSLRILWCKEKSKAGCRRKRNKKQERKQPTSGKMKPKIEHHRQQKTCLSKDTQE